MTVSGRRPAAGLPRLRGALAAALALILATVSLEAQTHVYLGRLSAEEATIAWGATRGNGNTIGRSSVFLKNSEVEIDGRRIAAEANWVDVKLQPDRNYNYKVRVSEREIGEGTLRTWPAKADKMSFFVIGDYGTGSSEQRRVAEAMNAEFDRLRRADNHVRFVITTGDNIYGVPLGFTTRNSGDRDSHWQTKFFEPYATLLKSVPFYASPGNHDGNESESRGDLEVYLDNFFFPGGLPARYYRFAFGDLAEFFSLDSTANNRGIFQPDGEQSRWLERSLAESKARWKIVYFHHPPFTAGPRHSPSLARLKHWVDMFEKHAVQVVFNGHEHNFQFTQQNGIDYFTSGSGGELRDGDVLGNLAPAGMRGWSAQHQFLSVELDREKMLVRPLGYETIRVFDPGGNEVGLPIEVRR